MSIFPSCGSAGSDGGGIRADVLVRNTYEINMAPEILNDGTTETNDVQVTSDNNDVTNQMTKL
jgi:hypothetical protein